MSPVLPERIFAGVPPESANWEHARVAILPVPYDSTVSSKVGAREGPRAIIDASLDLEWYDPELDRETYQVGIHTMPELEPVMSGPKGMLRAIAQAARQVVAQGKLLVTLGGEHTITAGAVEAVAERFPGLTVLQIDAHADLRDRYQGTRYNHACVMRRVIERCPIVNVGLRSLSREEAQFIRERGIPTFPLPETQLDPDTIARILAHLSQEVYVSIDLDGLDPGIMPAVGTPEPGGLGWDETLRLLREVATQRRVVAFDVTELCPSQGNYAACYLAAKLVYKMIGFVTT